MRRITLTQGRYATVDDKFFDQLARFAWCLHNQGYAVRRRSGGGVVLMHREVWKLAGRRLPKEIDHKDRARTNNQIANLRPATSFQQRGNAQRRQGSSKYKGVYWNKQKKRWAAECCHKYLGLFTKEREAGRAYDREARKRFGRFANTNFNDARTD